MKTKRDNEDHKCSSSKLNDNPGTEEKASNEKETSMDYSYLFMFPSGSYEGFYYAMMSSDK